MPIDHVYTRFGKDVGNTDGFSPAKPKPLLPLPTSASQTKWCVFEIETCILFVLETDTSKLF